MAGSKNKSSYFKNILSAPSLMFLFCVMAPVILAVSSYELFLKKEGFKLTTIQSDVDRTTYVYETGNEQIRLIDKQEGNDSLIIRSLSGEFEDQAYTFPTENTAGIKAKLSNGKRPTLTR